MTVLETDEALGERQNPPRKKLCLSLSGLSESRLQSSYKSQSQRASTSQSVSNFLTEGKMLSEFQRIGSNHCESNCDISYSIINGGQKIATLCNLGNTCFLNSVLYTLRFTPSFLHNLHHLAIDLSSLTEKHLQNKNKISSLGRIAVSSANIGSRSWSSKDLTSLVTANAGADIKKPRIQVATERLHELFVALRDLEAKENNDPFQPDAFVQALREVNPIFEGNQQQDAHELLVCILDNLRESFQLLVKHREDQLSWRGPLSADDVSLVKTTVDDDISNKQSSRKSLKKKKNNLRGSSVMVATSKTIIVENGVSSTQVPKKPNIDGTNNKKCFISENYEGISLLRTTCLECEQVTERKETFCDICVPVDVDRSDEKDEDGKAMDCSEVYRRALVTSELLYDKNKYWCANCLRYNEARRAICYPSLPRLLVLQLKRFSTLAGSMEKINNHMPTPFELQCFCEECLAGKTRHIYNLHSVIMHQGATMTAGHYVAYTRLPEELTSLEYRQCDRGNYPQTVGTGGKLKKDSTNAADNNHKITAFFNCFGNKQSVAEAKESPSMKKRCQSNSCCGIKMSDNKHDSTWFECDDDAVRSIALQELQEKLAPNHRNSATPYLLFYVKSSSTQNC